MDKDGLRALLASVLTPDTARVKEATAKLKKDYYNSPQSLAWLLQIMVSEDSVEVRQLAGTEARKLVPKHWPKIPDAQKPEVRSHLLKSTLNEPSKVVTHASSRLIGAIAQHDLANNQWTDLPNLMLDGAASQNPQAREVSTFMLFSILDEAEDSKILDYSRMFQVFSRTVQDLENPEVVMNTIVALSKVAIDLDTDSENHNLATFREFIPKIVNALMHFIDTHNSDNVTKTFECFQGILETSAKILDPHFRELVQGMATMAADNSKDVETRSQALNILSSCLLERKMKFQSLRLGEQLTSMLFNILASDASGPLEEDEKELTSSTLSLLTYMSSELPPPQVAGPAIVLFKKYASSSDVLERQTAITVIGAIVEGATEFISSQLPELFPAILKLLNDPADRVRESSVLAIRDVAYAIPEALAKRHEDFLTALANNLQSAMSGIQGEKAERSTRVAANCCLAIDGLVGGLNAKDVKSYMPELVPNLTRLFSHPDGDIKKSAISAVGSIATAAGKEFLQYFEQTASALSHFLQVKEPEEELELRSIATDVMGDLAEAVGSEAFRPYVQLLMTASQEGLELNHPRLKETSYMLWSSLAKAYKEEFNPFLAGAVKQLLDALAQDEDAEVEISEGGDETNLIGQEIIISGKKIKVVGAGDDDDDDDDDDDWNDISGFSDIAQEKAVALEALADISSHTGKEFLPYYEKAFTGILPLLEHDTESTKEEAIGAMFRLYASLWNLQPESQSKWTPGLPVQTAPSNEIVKVRDLLMEKMLSEYATEEDATIVVAYNSSLSDTLSACGPFLVSSQGAVETIIKGIIALTGKKHPCQLEYDDEPDFEDEEQSEDAWLIIESGFNVLCGLAAALGPQFAEIWKVLNKSIISHASATSLTERAATVGTLAEVIKGMKGGCTQWTDSLLKIIMHRLSDESTSVKANAVYAVGVLAESSENAAEIKKAYPSILTKLESLLQHDDQLILDNSAGCVSRLISKYPDSVPIGDVLPAMVDLLPLKEDYQENAPVWSMIVGLYKQGNPTVQELTPRIVPALEKTLEDEPEEQLKEETKDEVRDLVRYLESKHSGILDRFPGLAKVLQQPSQ